MSAPSDRLLDRVEQSVPYSDAVPAGVVLERSRVSQSHVQRALAALTQQGRIEASGLRSNRRYKRVRRPK